MTLFGVFLSFIISYFGISSLLITILILIEDRELGIGIWEPLSGIFFVVYPLDIIKDIYKRKFSWTKFFKSELPTLSEISFILKQSLPILFNSSCNYQNQQSYSLQYSLQKQQQQQKQEANCTICFDENREILFLPCNILLLVRYAQKDSRNAQYAEKQLVNMLLCICHKE